MIKNYRPLMFVAGIVFFFSGFASLAFQICWKRILTQTIGIDHTSTVIIISLFMLGLGLGSLFGGHITKKY